MTRLSIHRVARIALISVSMLLVCRCSDLAQQQRAESKQRSIEGNDITCGIALGKGLKESLKYGLNYELLSDFADTYGCNLEVMVITDSTDYADSLRSRMFDIVALKDGRDSLDYSGLDFSWSYDGVHCMAVHSDELSTLKKLNWRLAYLVHTGNYTEMESMFKVGYNPRKKAEEGVILKHLSPYDSAIKKHARELGWDWRMLAAIIYKESKFTINLVSRKGATGLMQVKPKTAARYGVTNLLDPEENIKAGTAFLKNIQDKYFSDGFTIEEKEKFTLAAYNAGNGRIADCRRLANEMGLDSHYWDNIVEVIPLMRDDEFIEQSESIQLGHFNGRETIAYVRDVLELYDAFCTICPN